MCSIQALVNSRAALRDTETAASIILGCTDSSISHTRSSAKNNYGGDEEVGKALSSFDCGTGTTHEKRWVAI